MKRESSREGGSISVVNERKAKVKAREGGEEEEQHVWRGARRKSKVCLGG